MYQCEATDRAKRRKAMKRKTYKCQQCGGVTTYHKEGYPCGYCGSKLVKEWHPQQLKEARE